MPIIICVFFGALGLLSYTSTSGTHVKDTVNSNSRVYVMPLKQKNVVVTSDYDAMKRMLHRGYVCEDVDLAFYSNTKAKKYYTMVKY